MPFVAFVNKTRGTFEDFALEFFYVISKPHKKDKMSAAQWCTKTSISTNNLNIFG